MGLGLMRAFITAGYGDSPEAAFQSVRRAASAPRRKGDLPGIEAKKEWVRLDAPGRPTRTGAEVQARSALTNAEYPWADPNGPAGAILFTDPEFPGCQSWLFFGWAANGGKP